MAEGGLLLGALARLAVGWVSIGSLPTTSKSRSFELVELVVLLKLMALTVELLILELSLLTVYDCCLLQLRPSMPSEPSTTVHLLLLPLVELAFVSDIELLCFMVVLELEMTFELWFAGGLSACLLAGTVLGGFFEGGGGRTGFFPTDGGSFSSDIFEVSLNLRLMEELLLSQIDDVVADLLIVDPALLDNLDFNSLLVASSFVICSTKLSGKNPTFPFSSPFHQPGS